MEFKIRLENVDPPTGWIVAAGQPDTRSIGEEAHWQLWFSGWLGLLQALDDVLGRAGSIAGGHPHH